MSSTTLLSAFRFIVLPEQNHFCALQLGNEETYAASIASTSLPLLRLISRLELSSPSFSHDDNNNNNNCSRDLAQLLLLHQQQEQHHPLMLTKLMLPTDFDQEDLQRLCKTTRTPDFFHELHCSGCRRIKSIPKELATHFAPHLRILSLRGVSRFPAGNKNNNQQQQQQQDEESVTAIQYLSSTLCVLNLSDTMITQKFLDSLFSSSSSSSCSSLFPRLTHLDLSETAVENLDFTSSNVLPALRRLVLMSCDRPGNFTLPSCCSVESVDASFNDLSPVNLKRLLLHGKNIKFIDTSCATSCAFEEEEEEREEEKETSSSSSSSSCRELILRSFLQGGTFFQVENQLSSILQLVPRIERLDLSLNSVIQQDHLNILFDSSSCSRCLRVLDLSNSSITSSNGLEKLPCLEILRLCSTVKLKSVASLQRSRSLIELDIQGSKIHATGTEGIEACWTLVKINVTGCPNIDMKSTEKKKKQQQQQQVEGEDVDENEDDENSCYYYDDEAIEHLLSRPDLHIVY